MDYQSLGAEIALPAYVGLDDRGIAAALTVRNVPTEGASAVLPSDFVARFSAAETVAILDSADAVVRALMLRLQTQREPMDMNGATVTQGLAYLAAKGLITADRVAEIAAAPPGAAVARCEQIGCAVMMDMDDRSRALAVAYAREISK